MIQILFSVMFAIFSFQMFSISYKANGVNKTLVYFPIELVKNSVTITNYHNDGFVYFNQEKFISYSNTYFDENISKYTNDYEIEYLFLDIDKEGICTTSKCQCVKISVFASFSFDFVYSKSMIYSIGESYGS